jgi:hypothetical protein
MNGIEIRKIKSPNSINPKPLKTSNGRGWRNNKPTIKSAGTRNTKKNIQKSTGFNDTNEAVRILSNINIA